MPISYNFVNETLIIDVEPLPHGLRVVLSESDAVRISARTLRNGIIEITEDVAVAIEDYKTVTRTYRVPFARTERGIDFSYNGQAYTILRADHRPVLQSGKAAGSGMLTAPMAGVVAEVLVHDGQIVEAYQLLAVVEAMKVMARLEAPFAGTVKHIHVQKGARIEHGAPLVEIVQFEPS